MKGHNRLRFLASLRVVWSGGLLLLCLVCGIYVQADTPKRSINIKSSGAYKLQGSDGKQVTMDASDLVTLANQIDDLESAYKVKTVQGLNSIGTYFDSTGEWTHTDSITPYPTDLTFEQLYNGILNSQTVTTGTIADNLSKDKAAWVNGKYIVGNGTDVNNAYNKGYQAGLNYAASSASIQYTYHQHVGSSGAYGGCYTSPVYHSHSGSPYAYGGCYTVPVYHQHSGSSSTGGGCYNVPVYGSYEVCHHHCYYYQPGGNLSENGHWDYHEGWIHPNDKGTVPGCTIADEMAQGLRDGYVHCDSHGDYEHSVYNTSKVTSWNIGCGLTAGASVDHYNPGCGRTAGVSIDRYALGCGKTAGVTIDEAHIVFP